MRSDEMRGQLRGQWLSAESGSLTRLVDAFRDQVVHHDADETVRPTQRELLLAQRRTTGIDARQDALRGRLLVAGRAVDLACEEETRDALRFERVCAQIYRSV